MKWAMRFVQLVLSCDVWLQMTLFSPTLESVIGDDDPVRLFDEVLAGSDWSLWEADYHGCVGQPAIHPRHLAQPFFTDCIGAFGVRVSWKKRLIIASISSGCCMGVALSTRLCLRPWPTSNTVAIEFAMLWCRLKPLKRRVGCWGEPRRKVRLRFPPPPPKRE